MSVIFLKLAILDSDLLLVAHSAFVVFDTRDDVSRCTVVKLHILLNFLKMAPKCFMMPCSFLVGFNRRYSCEKENVQNDRNYLFIEYATHAVQKYVTEISNSVVFVLIQAASAEPSYTAIV